MKHREKNSLSVRPILFTLLVVMSVLALTQGSWASKIHNKVKDNDYDGAFSDIHVEILNNYFYDLFVLNQSLRQIKDRLFTLLPDIAGQTRYAGNTFNQHEIEQLILTNEVNTSDEEGMNIERWVLDSAEENNTEQNRLSRYSLIDKEIPTTVLDRITHNFSMGEELSVLIDDVRTSHANVAVNEDKLNRLLNSAQGDDITAAVATLIYASAKVEEISGVDQRIRGHLADLNLAIVAGDKDLASAHHQACRAMLALHYHTNSSQSEKSSGRVLENPERFAAAWALSRETLNRMYSNAERRIDAGIARAMARRARAEE